MFGRRERDSLPPPLHDDAEVQPELDEDFDPAVAGMWGRKVDEHTKNAETIPSDKPLSGRARILQGKGSQTPAEDSGTPPADKPKSPGIGVILLRIVEAVKAIVFVIGLVAVLVTIFWRSPSVSSWFTSQPNFSSDISVVVTAVQACGELTTYKSYFEAIAEKVEPSNWPGKTRKILMVYGGTVDCGIDMRRANAEIFEAERRIRIVLPHCTVQRVYVAHDQSSDIKPVRVYHEEVGTLASHFNAGEQSDILNEATTRIRYESTKNAGILLQAEKSARDLFINFLTPLGYKVEVEFTDDEEKLKPSSDGERLSMGNGGVLVVHSVPKDKSKEAKK